MRALFLFLFVTFSLPSVCQVRIDVMAGPGLATFIGPDVVEWGTVDEKPKLLIKFHAGVSVNFTLNKLFSVESGLMYAAKGPRYKGVLSFYDMNGEYTETVTYKKKLAYLEVPAVLRFAATEKIDLFSGVKVGFLLSAKVKNEASAEARDFLGLDKTSDVKNDYKSTDLLWTLGLTYNVSDKIFIHAANDMGLTNIGKNSNAYPGVDFHGRIRNNVFRISLSYRIKD